MTFLNQFQRTLRVNKETGEQCIETTLEDIENANYLLKDILLKKSDRLTPACRRYFEQLKTYLKSEEKEQATNLEISLHFKKSLTTIKRNNYQLVDNGYLKTTTKKGSKVLLYEVTSFEEFDQLQNTVNTALDDVLEELKKNLKAKKSPKAQPKPKTKNGLSKAV